METKPDNLKKIPEAPKAKKPNRDTGIFNLGGSKFRVTSLEEKTAFIKNSEVPQLTPLHRLKRFKAIRDKNLKTKGGKKTLVKDYIKKMEELTSVSSTTEVEIKEKITETLIFEEVEVSNQNGIEKNVEDLKGVENGNSKENGYGESNGLLQEFQKPAKLKENVDENTVAESSEFQKDAKELILTDAEDLQSSESIPNNGTKQSIEVDAPSNKGYAESLAESDAVSSVSSQPVVNFSAGHTDDEEEVEIIESKPEYESSLTKNKLDSTDQEKVEITAGSPNSLKYTARPSIRSLSSSSIASSYKSSYGSSARIYGRRPVRFLTSGSRKRKLEDDIVGNREKRCNNSGSQPSPRWRFIPSSVNFWTPRTTPFVFPASTPLKTVNDSMDVNVDEETIQSHMNDSDLFSDTYEFAQQPAKKSRWGCAIM